MSKRKTEQGLGSKCAACAIASPCCVSVLEAESRLFAGLLSYLECCRKKSKSTLDSLNGQLDDEMADLRPMGDNNGRSKAVRPAGAESFSDDEDEVATPIGRMLVAFPTSAILSHAARVRHKAAFGCAQLSQGQPEH